MNTLWRLIHIVPASAEFEDRTDVVVVMRDPDGNLLQHIVYEGDLISALRGAVDWAEAKIKGV